MLSWMIILFSSLFGVDAVIKQQIEENISQGEERELAGGKIVIRKVYNRGFMLNVLEKKPKVVRGVTVAAGIGVLLSDILTFFPVRMVRAARSDGKAGIFHPCIRKGSYLQKFGMTLVSAGAASNIFDRLVRGRVIDYIGIRTGKKFPDKITVNLGDCYIACGGLILMIRDLFRLRG